MVQVFLFFAVNKEDLRNQSKESKDKIDGGDSGRDSLSKSVKDRK